ncbi:ATP-binding protein [Haliscomenobacter sp.]|uniref:ATP-binding protein n=1 Tax=Haliscomenobacter sp. TaxID=2717303 RepID=UPI0033650A81
MLILRTLYSTISSRLAPGKAVIVLGPRQAGKSTILDEIGKQSALKVLRLDCDDALVRQRLQDHTLPNLQSLIGDAELLLIDEAQRVKNIGLTLKIIIDQIKKPRLLVSGSSSFDLANEVNEPLTGRKWEFMLLPISTSEMVLHHGTFEESRHLHQRMMYGMYPEVVTHPELERQLLNQLASSYLYKDVFAFQELRKPELLDKLVRALALQIGSEVSFNNLASFLSCDIETIQRYIDLLEKSFIVFRLPAFSRNIRNELKRSRKIYFWDCGIRNALIGDFRPLDLRTDVGGLWENFLIAERRKYNLYREFYGQSYFWRTTQQQEIDYLEEYDGSIHTYEFKWNPSKGASLPEVFQKAYPNVGLKVVNPQNYLSFLTED